MDILVSLWNSLMILWRLCNYNTTHYGLKWKLENKTDLSSIQNRRKIQWKKNIQKNFRG